MKDDIASMTPAERMTRGLCPECGENLHNRSVLQHAGEHWPEYITPHGRNDDAITRQRMLRMYAKAQSEGN